MKLVRATLPATVEMQTNIDPEAGLVLADATQMHQLLLNLAANANYAMKEQGMLTIGLKGVIVDATLAGTCAAALCVAQPGAARLRPSSTSRANHWHSAATCSSWARS